MTAGLLSLIFALAVALLVAVAGVAIARGVAAVGGTGRARRVSERLVLLEQERERLLQALQEVDEDLAARKLSAEDHRALKAELQREAVEVLRALEREPDHDPAPSPELMALLLVALLGWVSVPSAHAMPGVEAPEGAAQQGWAVRVVAVAGDGGVDGVAGAAVLAEQLGPAGQGAPPAVARRWAATTGPAGWALFTDPAIASASALRLTAMRDGVQAAAEGAPFDLAGTELALPVAGTAERSALSIRVQASLDLNESSLEARVEYVLRNAGPRPLVLDAPLRLPWPSPVVAGAPLPAAILPPQTGKHIQVAAAGPGGGAAGIGARLAADGLWVTGVVAPGEGTRVSLAVPYDVADPSIQLGFRAGDIPLSDVLVALRANDRVALRLHADQPAWGSRFDGGGEATTLLRWLQPTPPGASATFRVEGLPGDRGLRHRLALGVLVAAAILGLTGAAHVRSVRRSLG